MMRSRGGGGDWTMALEDRDTNYQLHHQLFLLLFITVVFSTWIVELLLIYSMSTAVFDVSLL